MFPEREFTKGVPDALSRLCENHMPAKQEPKKKQGIIATLSALHWESTWQENLSFLSFLTPGVEFDKKRQEVNLRVELDKIYI